MNRPTPDSNDGPTELAELQARTEAARAELVRLQDAVAEAERRLFHRQSATELVEANERLVLATLSARSDAETAVSELEEVTRSAELDTLTGLPNRVLLLDRFAHAIAAAKRHGNRLALLFVDLDNFKQINDTLGHAVGDEMLKRAAQCLAACVREEDTVSRHGGDEFLILLDEVAEASDAVLVADKVIAALDGPHQVDGQALRLAASIGISLYPDDGGDVDTLIDRADAAMYRAKRQGFGSYVVHAEAPASERELPIPSSPQQALSRHEQALAEHDLRHAQQQEANEQLVLAALGAQELQATAEQAQRQQAEFLGVLAHELRNPLSPIRSAAALLGQAQSDETLLPRLQAIIERQVMHISRLVDDLLDVSRARTGKLRLERRAVEMRGLIDAAVDAGRPAMVARQQHLNVQAPACALQVQGDPVRLAQILNNLLDNASKYTPVGGQIGLAVAVVHDALELTVSDSGVGISAEALPHVFEPFVQDARATGFNGAGLGIGLTVVRELVEAHGGTVVASSAGSGLGSQFVVTLPLAGAA